MATTVLATAGGALASDYPVAADIDCYRHSPAEETAKPDVAYLPRACVSILCSVRGVRAAFDVLCSVPGLRVDVRNSNEHVYVSII